MNFKIKDRVKLINGDKKVKGTIVKVYYNKQTSSIRTCAVLWDNDWPKGSYDTPRLFYVKPNDLKYVDTWRLG